MSKREHIERLCSTLEKWSFTKNVAAGYSAIIMETGAIFTTIPEIYALDTKCTSKLVPITSIKRITEEEWKVLKY